MRLKDPDRFYAALFAPAARREALYALLAFNHEVARTREIVSQPMSGEFRLQWWRDALGTIEAGDAPAHPAAIALATAYRSFPFSLDRLKTLIEVREFDLYDEPMANLVALEAYAKATCGGLNRAMAQVLGANEEGEFAAEQAGTAWGLTGLLRALPAHARNARLYLPADRLALHGVKAEAIFEGAYCSGCTAVIAEAETLARGAYEHARLAKAGPAFSVVLPALALVPAYLTRVTRAARRGFNGSVDLSVPERLVRLAIVGLRAPQLKRKQRK